MAFLTFSTPLQKGGEKKRGGEKNQELNINFLKEMNYAQKNDKFSKYYFCAGFCQRSARD
jgi:hypothetical protein